MVRSNQNVKMTRHFGHFDILITTPTEEFILILSDGSDGAIPLPAISRANPASAKLPVSSLPLNRLKRVSAMTIPALLLLLSRIDSLIIIAINIASLSPASCYCK